MSFSPPEPLGTPHQVQDFNCGEESLNRWLRERGRRSEGRTARTYVVCDTSGDVDVIGFYCLSAGSLRHADAPGRLRRNAPDPIPVIVLGRLAVDLRYQGSGIGSGLVLDAMRRTVAASQIIGARGLLVHVLNERVLAFYLNLGFVQAALEDTVIIPVVTIERALLES